MTKVTGIFGKNKNTGVTLYPSRGLRGFCCALGSNRKEDQVFVPSLEEVYDYLLRGYSVRMSATGRGWGNLRALNGLTIV